MIFIDEKKRGERKKEGRKKEEKNSREIRIIDRKEEEEEEEVIKYRRLDRDRKFRIIERIRLRGEIRVVFLFLATVISIFQQAVNITFHVVS